MDLRDKLYSLFDGYLRAANYVAHNMAENASSSGANEKVRDANIAGFDTFESQIFGSIDSQSQLDVYVEETRFDHNTHMDLDILQYWESNCGRFAEHSLMACDIMSIPISTVASKSAFSIDDRILDKYRSCLLPQNAEALLCSCSWLFCGQGKSLFHLLVIFIKLCILPFYIYLLVFYFASYTWSWWGVEDFEHLCISGHITYNDEV